MNREQLFELHAFAERHALMNEPFDKVVNQFRDPNRLPEPPAIVVIK